jgi:hypothetical protein
MCFPKRPFFPVPMAACIYRVDILVLVVGWVNPVWRTSGSRVRHIRQPNQSDHITGLQTIRVVDSMISTQTGVFVGRACRREGLFSRKHPATVFSVLATTSLLWVTCKKTNFLNCEPGERNRYSGRGLGRSSCPGKEKAFFSSPCGPDRLWGPPSLLCNGYQG